jgi:hypothetical protein
MKSSLLHVLLLTIILCCCRQGGNQSKTRLATVKQEVNQFLADISDSCRVDGFLGWIPFLDSSDGFSWKFIDSTATYDSVVVRLRRTDPAELMKVSWDSVRVESSAEGTATLLTICTMSLFGAVEERSPMLLNLRAKLRKVEGAWKFHNCEFNERSWTQAGPSVAVADTSRLLAQEIDSLVKATLGHNYSSGGILDVDDRIANSSYRLYQEMGLLFEDPHHQLEHSYVVAVHICDSEGDWVPDSGSVAIIRENKLIWHSKFLVRNMEHGLLGGFGDVNGDGTTDILITTPLDMRGYSEELWIISPDSSGGRLLSAVDKEGESTIIGASGTFGFTRPKPDGAMVIKADDLEHPNHLFVYTWNGSVFARANSLRSGVKK